MSGVTLYVFGSPTCAPCKRVHAMVDTIAPDYPGLEVKFVNVMHDPEGLAQQYLVTSLPTMVLLNGQIRWHHRGFAPKLDVALRAEISKLIRASNASGSARHAA
jgi:thioredoxin-like negative regulator of GroEL